MGWSNDGGGSTLTDLMQSGPQAQLDLVRLARSQLDLVSFWREADRLLRRAVPFGLSCWYTFDPESEILSGHYNSAGQPLPRGLPENEYLQPDVNKYRELATASRPAGGLSEATGGHPERSRRFAELLGPRGWSDELRAAFVDGRLWGGLVLLRERGDPLYSPAEIALVAALSRHFGAAMRRGLISARTTVVTDEAPGVLVLDPHDELDSATPTATDWLADLPEVGQLRGPLPGVIRAVALRARSEPTEHDVPRVHLRSRSGRWLTVHAALLDGTAAGRVVVTIEAARSPDVLPFLAAAYGLTEREQQLLVLVLQGSTTGEIAHLLGLSPYTVQDHLKAIFEKTGVHSRGELSAAIYHGRFEPILKRTEVTWPDRID